jgi:hypothetical protein
MEQLPHNNTETANVPHAGNLPKGMREQPERHFDKTPLVDALKMVDENEQPILATPDTAESLLPPKKSRRILISVIGGAAAILVAGGAFLGISQAKNNGPDTDGPAEEVPFGEMPANPIPVETPPADPETEQTNPDSFEVYGLPSLAELEINADQSDEQIAENIVAVQNAWAASGANEEMYNLQYENGNDFLTQTEYIKKITDASDPIFIEALYGEKANDESFRERIEIQKEIHAAYILAHFQTYGAQSNVPFEQTEEFLDVNVVDPGDGTKTMHIRTELKDNADQNIVEPSNSGTITRISYVTAEVDGKIKLVENPNVVVQSR